MQNPVRTFVAMGYTLITGASKGIGADWAVRAAQAGQELTLVVRKAPDAQTTLDRVRAVRPDAQPLVLEADLAHLDQVEALLAQLDRLTQEGRVHDRLVNNAGFGDYAPLTDARPDVLRTMLEVNIQALVRISHWAVQNLPTGGRLANVASTAAFQAGPGMAAYYASKAFVLSFSEALSAEVKTKGLSVTIVCPGPTKTSFFDRAGLEKSHLVSQGLMPLMHSHTVAEVAFAKTESRALYAIPGFMNRLGTYMPNVVGRRGAAALVGWLQRAKRS